MFIINLNASNFQHLFPYAYIYTIVSLLKTIRPHIRFLAAPEIITRTIGGTLLTWAGAGFKTIRGSRGEQELLDKLLLIHEVIYS